MTAQIHSFVRAVVVAVTLIFVWIGLVAASPASPMMTTPGVRHPGGYTVDVWGCVVHVSVPNTPVSTSVCI